MSKLIIALAFASLIERITSWIPSRQKRDEERANDRREYRDGWLDGYNAATHDK